MRDEKGEKMRRSRGDKGGRTDGVMEGRREKEEGVRPKSLSSRPSLDVFHRRHVIALRERFVPMKTPPFAGSPSVIPHASEPPASSPTSNTDGRIKTTADTGRAAVSKKAGPVSSRDYGEKHVYF